MITLVVLALDIRDGNYIDREVAKVVSALLLFELGAYGLIMEYI